MKAASSTLAPVNRHRRGGEGPPANGGGRALGARAPDSLAEMKNEIDRLLCQQPK